MISTILVPTDFSPTAKNSCLYAAHFARQVGATHLVLYNAYSMPLATEMSWAILQTEELQQASEESLNEAKNQLEEVLEGALEVSVLSHFGFLQERIADAVAEVKADLIVMGITGGGKLQEVLIGSNTTHVIHNVDVPVLIIPPNSLWQPVRNIGWACDYKDVLKTTPAEAIKKMVNLLHARLIVVHNAEDSDAFDPEMFHNNIVVGDLFKSLNPEFVFEAKETLTEAIDQFIEEYKVDMMLVIPKKYGWLESLFRTRHTTRLAFHTHLPLLCMRAIG